MAPEEKPAEGPPTDIHWLTGLLISGALLFAFWRLADEMLEGDTATIDRALLLLARDPADHNRLFGPAWLPEMLRDITSLGSAVILVLIVLMAAGYLVFRRKRFAAIALIVSVALGQVLSTVFKLFFDRPRPDLVTDIPTVFSTSFPSGHAMLSAVTYLTLGAILARFETRRALQHYILAIAVTVTLVVGTSRVLLAVHWPSDVAAGWLLGAAWALLCSLVWTRVGRDRGWLRAGE